MSYADTTYRSGFRPSELREPGIARFLFADTRASWIWLIVRIYIGWQWLEAGWEKVNSAAWTGPKAGAALSGFVNGALKQTGGEHPNVQGWYATFLSDFVLPNASTFGFIVAWGELLVGLGLILGALTGIAAFFGIVMNANYLLAGAVSTNPILIILGALVMMAWRNAGWIGLDRWLLPLLGTPWQPGRAFRHDDADRRETAPRTSERDLGPAAIREREPDAGVAADTGPETPPVYRPGAGFRPVVPEPADRTARTNLDRPGSEDAEALRDEARAGDYHEATDEGGGPRESY